MSPFISFTEHAELFQVYNLLRYPTDSPQSEVVEMMLKATNEERGTVAGLMALMETLDDEQADGASSTTLHAKAILLNLFHNRERIVRP
jgi:hypothetical protein